MDSYEDADLDLYIFRDSDENGVFESGEELKRSWSGTSAESITIDSPENGNYSVAVHGWSVSESVQFWIDVEVVAGNSLNVTNSSLLNQSDIANIWPNGSDTLAGDIPEGALELNIDYQMPESEGVWEGFVEITLEGGISMRLPFTYELIELDPEIEFVTPENLTQTNVTLPLSLHAKDIGSGFSIDALDWLGVSNSTLVPEATSVEATLWNLSSLDITQLWNSENHSSNLTFREVWVNSSLPENEQWHDYTASISDMSGRSSTDWLSLKYDTISPILIISHIPQITDQSLLEVSIQTELDAILKFDQTIIETDSNGSAQLTIILDESEIFWMNPLGAPLFRQYIVNGNNTFLISVIDPAGNEYQESFDIILDSTAPSIESISLSTNDPIHNFVNGSWEGTSLNITKAFGTFSITADWKSMCVSFIDSNINNDLELCQNMTESPSFANQPGTLHNEYNTNHLLLDFENLTDDNYQMKVEISDWMGNSNHYEYSLILDRTLPEVSWDISPTDESILGDHRLGLSWTASEDVHLQFSHNVGGVEEWNGSYGGLFYNLSETGDHEFCIEAWDSTESQHNPNYYYECKIYTLSPSLYTSQVWANWDGTVVGTETVQLVFQRGPGQWATVKHVPDGAEVSELEPIHVFDSGLSFIEVELELDEGENEFKLDIGALDHTESYWLHVTRDTITPKLNLTEVDNRTTNLEPERIIYGVCEYGATVSISTEISSTSFICTNSENFTVTLGVPANQGWHSINATSVDLGGNTNQYGIEVQYQEWSDWALDDIKEGGPILYYGSSALIILLSILGVLRRKIRQRHLRRNKSIELLDSDLESNDGLIEERVPPKPHQPLPEEDELRAWAQGERNLQSWRDRVPEDVTDID